nr:YafY family protein [Evansella caseinilytica]
MKINRLLEMTILLLNKKTVTAKELAERFEVSTRTIYRDVDVLSTAGVPVYTNKGNGGGISLLDNFALNKALISDSESESLLFALKTLQATNYPEVDAVLEKIGALFKNAAAADWVHIDFSHWGSKPDESRKFAEIKKAILKRKITGFDYVNSAGNKSARSIEPLRLIFKGQAWYLSGYCRTRQAFRTFRISRMKHIVVTNETFHRRTEECPEMIDNHDAPQNVLVNLKLRFYPPVVYRLYDEFDDELITKKPDGTWEVRVTFPEGEWIYGYILSFGPYVEVLSPDRVRGIIAERARKIIRFYDK